MLLQLVRRNISRSLGTDKACELGATAKRNIPDADKKNNYYCINCLHMLKTYQKETKLVVF